MFLILISVNVFLDNYYCLFSKYLFVSGFGLIEKNLVYPKCILVIK